MKLSRKRRQRGQAEIKQLVCFLAAVLVIYLFVITWPASFAFVLALLLWFFTRDSKSLIGRAIHDAALPVLVGISLFCIVTLAVTHAPQVSDNGRAWLIAAEQTFLRARLAVHLLSGPHLTVYLLLLGILLVLLLFFHKSQAIGQLIRTKKGLQRLHLCLLALTSFTLFGGRELDGLAQKDHANRLHQFEVSLRSELKPAKEFLAKELANDTMRQALKDAIPALPKSRFLYLFERLKEPQYVQVLDTSNVPSHLTKIQQVQWLFEHPKHYEFVPVDPPVDPSVLMKTFIVELSREVEAQGPDGHSRAQSSAMDLESLAQKRFGPLAESPEERQRQQQLIGDEEVFVLRSKKFYGQASKGLTEAVTTTFSEALGALLPEITALAKEWMKELIDEAIVPLCERRVEAHAESVLQWSRQNISESRIQRVPEQLKQKLQPSQQVAKEFLVPRFLLGRGAFQSGDTGLPSSAGMAEAEFRDEILRRVNTAKQEAIEKREHLSSLSGGAKTADSFPRREELREGPKTRGKSPPNRR